MAQQDPESMQDSEAGSDGFYCSTSGTTFTERGALTSHYRSELHRYNLKRKVAGLPPVTAEWFEARRDQLASIQSQAQAEAQQVYVCPLTGKRFQSEGTYESHTRTKKFQAAMKKAGLEEAPPPKVLPKPQAPVDASVTQAGAGDPVDDVASDGDWETDSEEAMDEDVGAPSADAGAAQTRSSSDTVLPADQWEKWDLKRSLFDNHMSSSFEKNLQYMYKHFHFALPDPEFLTDAEGLLQYLGAKLQYGHVALYSRGDDANAKKFGSLHAVQRHMVDSNRCQMLYDGNEEEYEEFYDYGDADSDEEQQLALASSIEVTPASELVVSRGPDSSSVLGSRAFRHLYKQRHKPVPAHSAPGGRGNVVAAVPSGQRSHNSQVVAAYRQLGVPQVTQAELAQRKDRRKLDKRRNWGRLKSEMANDKIQNLPKNVPY